MDSGLVSRFPTGRVGRIEEKQIEEKHRRIHYEALAGPHARTVGDWLGLALGTALIFGGVAQLPALAAALGRLAAMLRPFLWGLVLAYVLDIPTRWLAA